MKNEIIKDLKKVCDEIQNHMGTIQAKRYEISYKSDNTPVTEADIFIEQLVKEYFENRFSKIKFIGEESYNADLSNMDELVVILDPIDGTENFCSGLPEWGISLGIWSERKYLAGMIYLPEMNLRIISGDKINKRSSRIIGLSSSIKETLIESLEIGGQYRIMGCAVYNLYNVITGTYSKFLNPVGVKVWDFLPGVMLALEHGCEVKVNNKVFTGELLDPNQIYCIEISR